MVPAYILIVDDDNERLDRLRSVLQDAFREQDAVFTLGSTEWLSGSQDLIRRNPVQVILAGSWKGWEQSEIRKAIAGSYPDIPVCFIDEDAGAGRAGDEALEPLETNPINDRIHRIIRGTESTGDQPVPREQIRGVSSWMFRGLSGDSPAIQNVRNDITLVAASDSTVLITGAPGTGKEIAARNLHFQSPRRLAPFVPVRCAAMPPGRLDSELFGLDNGAGEANVHRSVFERADGGTLFLHEIGAMPASTQLKLLQVLRERTFAQAGDGGPPQVNVRLVATTHHDLGQLVAEGRFREDLRQCLSVFPIRIPRLQEREEDLPVLASEVQRRMQRTSAGQMTFSRDALEVLKQYSWPENIRELSGLVERLANLYPGREVDVDELPQEYGPRAIAGHASPAAATAAEPRIPDSHPQGLDLERYLADMERTLVRQALEDSGGVAEKAAERLNLHPDTLAERMRKHGI